MALLHKKEFSAKSLTPAMFLCNPTPAEQTTKKKIEKRTRKKKKRKALSLLPHIHTRLYQMGLFMAAHKRVTRRNVCR